MSRLAVFGLMFPLALLCLGASHECDDAAILEVKLPALEEAQQQIREMEAATAVAVANEPSPEMKAWLAEQMKDVTPPPLGTSPHNPIKITPQKLTDEFRANKVRFERDYANRWYMITGKVKTITDKEIFLEVPGFGRPITGALQPLTSEMGEVDILNATVGEEFTTTCYLQPSSMVGDFYLLIQCATGWN